MIVPVVIGALWLAAAVFYALGQAWIFAGVAALAPEGVTVDTDDLPGWPFPVILLSGLLAIAALISALVRLL